MRNEVSDETIRALKLAWAGDDVRFEGRGYKAGGNSIGFRPVQQPHPPIWVGGNSRSAIRRAIELGDGWVPFPNTAEMAKYTRTPAMETLDDLKERLAFAREHAATIGRRERSEVCCWLVGMGAGRLGRRRRAGAPGRGAGVTLAHGGIPAERGANTSRRSKASPRDVIGRGASVAPSPARRSCGRRTRADPQGVSVA
jgi:hypothetical protein